MNSVRKALATGFLQLIPKFLNLPIKWARNLKGFNGRIYPRIERSFFASIKGFQFNLGRFGFDNQGFVKVNFSIFNKPGMWMVNSHALGVLFELMRCGCDFLLAHDFNYLTLWKTLGYDHDAQVMKLKTPLSKLGSKMMIGEMSDER